MSGALVERPASRTELVRLLAAASRRRAGVEIAGGGAHRALARPAPAPAVRLQTAGLARVVDHTPADLTVTVEGGHDATALSRVLAAHGQWWPQADIRPGATVGGILAAGASGRDRLREGPVRDSVLEVVVATGDGRLVTAGGRTVKNVSGFDLPRLMVGARGTLGVIVQVTLKLWPLPAASGWFRAAGTPEETLARAAALVAAPVRPAAVLLTPGAAYARLVGPAADVIAPPGWSATDGPPGPPGGGASLAVGVPPLRVGELVVGLHDRDLAFEAQAGVGACVVGVDSPAAATGVRELATALGGHAVVRHDGLGLGLDPFGPAPAGVVQMGRLRDAFDPAHILNRGRFVGDGAPAAVPA